MKNEDKNKLNSNDNLEELMKTATEKVDESLDNKNKDKKPKSTKKIVISAVAGLALFGVILFAGATMLDENQDFEDKTETPDWVGNERKIVDRDDDYNPWEFERPIEVKSWALEPYDKDTFWEQEDIEEEILEISKDDYRSFYFSVAWMRSGTPHGYDDEELSGPYTNDTTEMFLDNGEENPNFSYTVAEDYEKAYVVYMERLLNPAFGGWSDIQKSLDGTRDIKDERDYNVFKDMFSDEWWNANIKESEDYTSLPILAEWEIGEWDNLNLKGVEMNSQGVFYGQVKETEDSMINSQNIGVDNEGQPVMKVTSPVEYTAFGDNGKEVKITGTLELTLQSNEDSIDVRNRVVISDAKLTLK